MRLLLRAFSVLPLLVGAANADLLTGTYTLFGAGPNAAFQNMDGSYTLHAQGPGPYNPNPVGAFVRFILDTPVPFSSITGLDAVFTATAGGNALGSPRFSLITDAPTQYKNIVILEGP